MKDYVLEKIQTIAKFLKQKMVVKKIPIDYMYYVETGFKKDARPPMPDESWDKLMFSTSMRGPDRHYWVYRNLNTPKADNNHQKLYFELMTGHINGWDPANPQCLFYIDGQLIQGLDTNHIDVIIDFDKQCDFHLNMFTGVWDEQFYFEPSFKVVDTLIEDVYYDILVPCEALNYLDEKSDDYITTITHLEVACNLLDLRESYTDAFYNSIKKCSEYLKNEYYGKVCGKSDVTVNCVGHTHIDVAYKWPLRQTEEKAQHSFATVLKLMEHYPEYKFMSSQPQLYEFVKMYDNELYGRIKQKVKDGSFEPEGAMWLEADCNLLSSESFVRQIMVGKKFFRDEFGVESRILWLPDVFGYSATLPQILKKSGVDKFVTSKISWNEHNKMPYDIFMWEGLDGSEIFTHFLTTQEYKKNEDVNLTTYSGTITPGFVLGTNMRNQQKQYSNRTLIPFGYGDGGGGANEEMLQYQRRLSYGIPGIPKTVVEPLRDFLDKLEDDFKKSGKNLKKYPRWVGELYLEFHRGTYTSVAKNKKNNRDCEFLMQNTELFESINNLLFKSDYHKDKIDELWKIMLLNQFHDIIPGSSVGDVYIDSDNHYKYVREQGEKLKSDALKQIACSTGSDYTVFNSNSFEVEGYSKLDGKTVYVGKVAPLGWSTPCTIVDTNNISVSDSRIENKYYIIDFDKNYNIVSLYDKTNNRQVIKKGEVANRIEVYEDLPYRNDNWDISQYYKQKKWYADEVESFEIINDGARAGYKISRKILSSTFTQYIYVYDNCPRIDFETDIDWVQEHVILKAAFPVDVHTDKASFETQFGYVERPTHENTSWDVSRYEVCAHKYVDVSEDDYGVALLNNCKYGHNIEGSTIKLTILKCGTFPWENADKDRHIFTYSLYPHSGNHKEGGVVQQGYALNKPVTLVAGGGDGTIADTFTFAKTNKENVIIDTVKKAENDNGYIVRLYDAYNRKCKADVTFGFDIKNAYICDLMENKLSKIDISDSRKISVDVGNFEIVTLYIE